MNKVISVSLHHLPGETRVVFGHWLPSEGTPVRLSEAIGILGTSKDSPAGTSVVPQELSVVTGGEHQKTVSGRKGEEEDGPQVKLEDVEEGGREGKVEDVEEGGREGKVEDVEEGGGEGKVEDVEEGGGEGNVEEVEEGGIQVKLEEGEEGGQGERLLVSPTEEDDRSEKGGKKEEVVGMETQVNIGERSGELAEAEPSQVPCSEPLVVVHAEPSRDHVDPHHQVKTAWEEGAKALQRDHETATPTSQHADHRPGVMEVLDIEIINPNAANHTESEARSSGSKPISKLQDSRPLGENEEEEKFSTSAGDLMPQVRRLENSWRTCFLLCYVLV